MGTGGPKNFEIHLTSKKHLMNVNAEEDMSKTVKNALISDFFIKQRDPPQPFQAPSAPQLLAPNTPTLTPAGPSRAPRIGTSGVTSTQAHRSHLLVSRLRTTSARLPESDLFAVFSGDPRDSIEADDDPWESVIDPCLNRVIGFGVSTRQIADLIRRGPYGIDGFCRWIEICMIELEVSPELLEMKLERIFDALGLLYASFLALIMKATPHTVLSPQSGADDGPDIIPAVIESSPSVLISPDRGSSSVSHFELISPIASIASDNTNQNKSRTQSTSYKHRRLKHCRGTLLDFGGGRTPAFSYPSQIHGAKSVPWTTLYSDQEIWVQSDDCQRKIPSGDNIDACPPCHDLLNHPIIRGIMKCDKLGARENTPYQWLSHNHIS